MTKEEAHDTLIYPLMGKILEICKQHKIPMVADFGLEDDVHCTSCLLDDEFDPSPGQKKAVQILYEPISSFALTISLGPQRIGGDDDN